MSINNAQEEYERLKTLEFIKASPDSFLIAPEVLAPDLYFDPHWWSEVQEKFNYREDDIPRGIRLLSGDPEEVVSENPENWTIDEFYLLEQYSLTETGQVIEHIYLDSTVFYYNEEGQLRQSVSWTYDYEPEIETIRLYNYDGFGNILWNAVYFNNEGDIYLNHYETFRYLVSDSGFYMRRNHYFVNDPELQNLDESVEYAFYNQQGELQRNYRRYSGGSVAFTPYHYTKEPNGAEQISSALYDLHERGGQAHSKEELRFDEHGRKVFSGSYSLRGYITYADIDSTVYISENEEHLYNTAHNGPYKNALIITKKDDYGNSERREIYDLDSETPNTIEILTVDKNFLMEYGTWQYQIKDQTFWDGGSSKEYYMRDFWDRKLTNHDPTYKDDPVLIGLIEICIPPEKR